MANFKKIDDKDFVFIKKPLTPKEEKEFSDFLKIRKSMTKAKRPLRKTILKKRKLPDKCRIIYASRAVSQFYNDFL
ncbi:hypothetical protein EMGBS15_16380 [Filimonas sp.]|nr:hypothetical protein EMGBS15_16380 [Filimonas sp.]